MLDSCGLSGGSYVNNDRAAGLGKSTIVRRQGFAGSALPPVKQNTTWRAGTVVEVAWGMLVNHGGRRLGIPWQQRTVLLHCTALHTAVHYPVPPRPALSCTVLPCSAMPCPALPFLFLRTTKNRLHLHEGMFLCVVLIFKQPRRVHLQAVSGRLSVGRGLLLEASTQVPR